MPNLANNVFDPSDEAEFIKLFLASNTLEQTNDSETLISWRDHVLPYIENANNHNLLLIKYTDIVSDFSNIVRLLCEFLGSAQVEIQGPGVSQDVCSQDMVQEFNKVFRTNWDLVTSGPVCGSDSD